MWCFRVSKASGWFFVAAVQILPTAVPTVEADTGNAAREEARKAVNRVQEIRRNQWQSGEAYASIDFKWRRSSGVMHVQRDHVLYFDANRTRNDRVTKAFSKDTSDVGTRVSVSRTPREVRRVHSVTSATIGAVDANQNEIIDLRGIAFSIVPFEDLCRYPYPGELPRLLNADNLRAHSRVVEGVECRCFTGKIGNAEVSAFFDMEGRYRGFEAVGHGTDRVWIERFLDDRHEVPEVVLFTSGDASAGIREEVTFTTFTLGRQHADSTFSFDAMGLEAGDQVVDTRDGRRLIWTGAKLVDSDDAEAVAGGLSRTWLWFSASGVLLLAMAAALLMKRA